jgi:hypothetical protein
MRLHKDDHRTNAARLQLLLRIALCKVAWFIDELNHGRRLRTECDVRLKQNGAKFWLDRIQDKGSPFDFGAIAAAAAGTDALGITSEAVGFDKDRSPLVLKHVGTKATADDSSGSDDGSSDNADASADEGGDS